MRKDNVDLLRHGVAYVMKLDIHVLVNGRTPERTSIHVINIPMTIYKDRLLH